MLQSGLTKGSIKEYLKRELDDNRCTSFQTADEHWSAFELVEHRFRPKPGAHCHVGPEHFTLTTCYTASGYFLAIYLSQIIWSSFPSAF